jgi:protein-tyrosine phosphatase
MAEVLLRRALAARGVEVTVSSAGCLPGGVAASGGSVRAMAARGLDLGAHLSRRMTADEVAAADLVLCMARSHAREAVVLEPSAWPRTFPLKDLVRRGERVGARRPDEPLDDWLVRVGEGRARRDLLADDPADDVADPIGGPDRAYEATAVLLEDLVGRVVDLAFPPAADR